MKKHIVIIGAGAAGVMTALSLAPTPVILLSAAPLGENCSSTLAQGGLAAAVDKADTPAQHAADTLNAAAGVAAADIVFALTADAPAAAARLTELGVAFDRDESGAFKLNREACHSRRRVLKARAGDGFGRELMRALVAAVKNTPSITVIENISAERLIVQKEQGGARVVGVATDRGVFSASAVVLATGGIGGLYAATTNPLSSVGRGLALAARAGALLSDLEFVQFHPTALDLGFDPAPLASEALRGDGALLLNSRGERFMMHYHPLAELAPRDVVSRAIFSEMRRGQKTYLDCRALDTAHFPALRSACEKARLNPQHDLVPVFPVAHYHMGGVATDLDGRTSLNGLWAAGEVAATGLHGANRLASNSLMEAVVMARRVAADVSPRVAADISYLIADNIAPMSLHTDRSQAARDHLRHIMTDFFGVVREGRLMQDGLGEVAAIEETSRNEAALADMALVARMIAVSALMREESRGAHFRRDRPTAIAQKARRSFITLAEADILTKQLLAPKKTNPRIREDVA